MDSKYEVRELAEKKFEYWDQLVRESRQGTLFHKTLWLKASDRPFKILGCFDANDQLLGGIPIAYHKRFGLTMIIPPPLTPYLGVVFRNDNSKYVSKISREKHIARCLAEHIRQTTHFAYISLGFDFVDLQPFLWEGFSSTISYTYLLKLGHLEDLWKGMDAKRRNDITRAEKEGVYVERSRDFEQTFALVEKSYERQEKSPSFKLAAFRYNKALSREDQCLSFLATNKNGKAIAAVYIVWDQKRSYYILGGYDAAARQHGASAISMWEAIKFTKEELGLDQFDFEGSMIQPVERFFRKFGGRLTPCYAATWCKPYLKPLWLGYEFVRRRT